MSNGRLILHPASPAVIPCSIVGLIKDLQDIKFLATPLETASGNRYLAGARFLNLVTFLGCSPHVPLLPKGNAYLDFCHVAISGPWNAVRFVAGSMSAPPRCPRCDQKNPSWKKMIEVWENDQAGFSWTCPACGTASKVTSLNWRRGAGFGRFFLEIMNIFPGEAVPGDELLRTLAASTNTPWTYFYAAP